MEIDDNNQPYAVTKVYRYDLEGTAEEFIKEIEAIRIAFRHHEMLVEGGQMKNE